MKKPPSIQATLTQAFPCPTHHREVSIWVSHLASTTLPNQQLDHVHATNLYTINYTDLWTLDSELTKH